MPIVPKSGQQTYVRLTRVFLYYLLPLTHVFLYCLILFHDMPFSFTIHIPHYVRVLNSCPQSLSSMFRQEWGSRFSILSISKTFPFNGSLISMYKCFNMLQFHFTLLVSLLFIRSTYLFTQLFCNITLICVSF